MKKSREEAAADALRAGQVVAIPTDTVYGLACLLEHQAALFEAKGRPADRQVPVIAADADQAWTVGVPTELARRLAAEHWPGATTIVVARGDDPASTVGLRVPAHEVPRALCRALGPLACTSANRHGQPPLTTAAAVQESFPDLIVLDGGTCDGVPSQVIDATGGEAKVLRPRA